MTSPTYGRQSGNEDEAQPGAALAPNPDQVNEFHRYDDSDNSPESHHHTLGVDPNQASPGDHNHDGRNSFLISDTANNPTPQYREVGAVGEPAYTNSWVAFANVNFHDLGFTKDSLGFVHLRGMAKSGSLNLPMYTLPVGYRPLKRLTFVVVSNNAIGRVDIYADGSVVPEVGSATWITTSGITFLAEQ